jgi:hypothetical protein
MRSDDVLLIGDLLKDLQRETDSGLALVGASFLDERLRLMLAAYLGGDTRQVYQNLLRHDRPLGAAKARLNMCHALGLINDRERDQMRLIFEVRNEFSHKVLTQSFDGHKGDTTVPDTVSKLSPDLPDESLTYSRRSLFVFSIVEMWVALWYRHEWIAQLRSKTPMWLQIREHRPASE